MTPFQKHKLKWGSCERCDLCQTRDKICLVRGKLPSDVLFVGEAPGPSEDVIGLPFVGPAGRLLDEIIAEASNGIYTSPENRGWDELRFAFTNLVACIPKSEETGEKFTEPPDYAIKKCRPRLDEIVGLVSPRLIVCVGKLAVKHVMGSYREKVKYAVEIVHPAAILRSQEATRSLAIKRCIVTLSEAFTKLVSK